MALDKKHYDRGTIDSAKELDAYGVWVKSEPQDFTASMAETADFDAGAMPYEADFDAGFSDLGASGFDFGETDETGFAETGIDDSDDGGFGAGAYSEQISEEESSRLLMKIAGELSSIKTELNSLKKEFAEIRAESGSGAAEGEKHSGFFSEDDDEKIALTGDEMDHFLSSTDFSEEDGLAYDSMREADEAALKEISEQNEAAEEDASSEELPSSDGAEDEEIKIDFDNLGIDIDQDTETETLDEFPPLEDEPPFDEPALEAAENDLDTSSLDDLSFDGDLGHEEESGDFEELTPLEDSEELRDLRLEGASPLTPPPDSTVYLETDPFALDASDFEGTPLDSNAVQEEPILDDDAVTEESAAQDAVLDDSAEESVVEETALSDANEFSEEISTGDSLDDALGGGNDLSFDDSSFDMSFDDDDNFSIESSSATQEEAGETLETAAPESSASALDESDLTFDTEIALDSGSAESLDDGDLSFDAGSTETAGSLDDSDLTFDTPVTLDSDSAETLDDGDLSLDAASPETSGSLDDSDLSFDAGPLELSATGLDDTDFSFDDGDSLEIAEDASDEGSDELETAASAEQEFDADSIDLTDAVIDEPDLSAGLVEPPLEEPVLGDISFNDDISLDMDDFASHVDMVPADVSAVSARAVDDGGDNSLAQIIPEGFEVNAQEAPVSVDDDLEAFSDDDLSITAGTSLADVSADRGGGADIGIAPGLKGELKSVLAYMDHLLESLPEEKIEEFAKSEYFDTYKKIFKELGLV
jgi:hypothetical protein